MDNELKLCRSFIPVEPPVPEGYKKCPECAKLLQLRGYGGHMWGVHGIRVGDRARLQRVYDWVMATTRDHETGIIRIPDDSPVVKLYQPAKKS